MLDLGMIIDGCQVMGQNSFAVFNPATGKAIGSVANSTIDELDRAVCAAKSAYPAWTALPDADRKAAIDKLAIQLETHQQKLAQLITQEQGKPLAGPGSNFEAGAAVAWTRYTANLEMPVKVLQDTSEGRVELHRKSLGVVGSITPWNWPLMIAIWHIMPALRAGNTVVIKPSPFTPLSTLLAVQIMNEVLPAGVLNVVTSNDQEANIGAAMAQHPDIRKIVFTGSTPTGEKIMQGASATMKRLTLELGGNDAGIILPDVNPTAIAEGLFWGAFINSGQTCACMKRMYVHDSVHDAVCEALLNLAKTIPMGNGMDDGILLGPLTTADQHAKVSDLVAQGAASGNVLLGGESGEGQFFHPTIISELDNSNALVAEEQFGPALPIIRYSDIDEALALANEFDVGLGGSIWSSDTDAAKSLAMRMECGSVWINNHGAIQPNAPFGGIKKSGIGVEFGEEGLFENTDMQVIFA
ncbi:aldehyde dehydrogenase family protein [Marinomonas transparens]|uniref:Aldehyde dehydrogenase family protein n=1 Tax=Marinomonas transparens TaxID=2795388 RepID=A0A934JLI7_9GAMM|nr:aldehyde dehydrogenase family protein [Marinomonas transparens]MBJ7536578.1 aldehyde dehydrogenase family protein [Marinomonas transparens]